MEEEKRKKGFHVENLLFGILFLVVAVVVFTTPQSALFLLSMMLGVTIIFVGITKCIRYSIWNKLLPKKYAMGNLIMGIIDIVLGIFILFQWRIGIMSLVYMLAFWFITNSIFGLVNVKHIKQFDVTRYYFAIAINIIGLVIGICLLFNPIASAIGIALLLGVYFLVEAVLNFVLAFTKEA